MRSGLINYLPFGATLSKNQSENDRKPQDVEDPRSKKKEK